VKQREAIIPEFLEYKDPDYMRTLEPNDREGRQQRPSSSQ